MLIDTVQSWIKSVFENVDNVEKIIGIVGFLFGTVITVIKGMSAFLTLVSASRIEIAFMSKKEQMKLNITNVITMFGAFLLSNCICGYMLREFLELSMIFLLLGLVVFFTVMIMRAYRGVRHIHFVRLLEFLTKSLARRIWGDMKRMCGKIRSYIVDMLTRNKYILVAINGYKKVWIESTLPEPRIETKKQTNKNFAENVLFFSIMLIELSLNSFIWGATMKKSLALYIPFAASVLLTVLLLELLFLIVRKNPLRIWAKAYIYDDNSNQKKYIFFRHDETCCIAGNAPVLEEVSEYHLLEYDKILGKTIYPVLTLRDENNIEKAPILEGSNS